MTRLAVDSVMFDLFTSFSAEMILSTPVLFRQQANICVTAAASVVRDAYDDAHWYVQEFLFRDNI